MNNPRNLFVLLAIILLTSCNNLAIDSSSSSEILIDTPITTITPRTTSTPIATYPTNQPDNETPPDVISHVYPNSIICQEEYEESLLKEYFVGRGIMFTFWDDLEKLKSLSVDGEVLSTDTMTYADGLMPGPYYMSWAPILEHGEHEARIDYVGSDGVLQSYSWKFVITASVGETEIVIPTPKPTPLGIYDIDPEPSDTLCRTTYERWLANPGDYHGGILIKANLGKLGIEEFNWNEQFILDHVTLYVDGERLDTKSQNLELYDSNEYMHLNWLIDLSPDLHEVVLVITNQDKDPIIYDWYFLITDN